MLSSHGFGSVEFSHRRFVVCGLWSMKFLVSLMISLLCAGGLADEMKVVPPDPPIEEYEKRARNADIIVLVGVDETVKAPTPCIREVWHGKEALKGNEEAVRKLISGLRVGRKGGFSLLEVCFIRLSSGPGVDHRGSSLLIRPEFTEKIGTQRFRFEQFTTVEIKAAIAVSLEKALKERGDEASESVDPESKLKIKPKPKPKNALELCSQ